MAVEMQTKWTDGIQIFEFGPKGGVLDAGLFGGIISIIISSCHSTTNHHALHQLVITSRFLSTRRY